MVVLLAAGVLAYMSFKVGGFSLFREDGYHLSAVFDSVSGLDERSQIRIAGVEVGQVESVSLDGDAARVSMRIQPSVRIKKGGYAVIRSSGLLGDRYVEIVPGADAAFLGDGDILPSHREAPDMENIMDRFSGIADDVKAVTAALREIFVGREGNDAIKEILWNAQKFTKGIYDFVKDNRDSLGRSVYNFETFSESLSDQGNALFQNLNSLIRKVERGEGTLGKLITDESAYEKLNSSLDDLAQTLKGLREVTKKVERGEGTIGKLFSDEKVYENLSTALEGLGSAIGRVERFKMYIGLRNEYQLQGDENKGYFTLRLQPRIDKYYLMEVIDDPRGRVTEETEVKTTNGVASTITSLKTQRGLKISAQFGRQMDDLGLRLGLVESSFGIGADYIFPDENFSVSLDVWDFNSDDPMSKRAHLKLTTAYTLLEHIRLEVGYDQILNRSLDTYFLGAGLTFEDDDFKYLLSGISGLAR